MRNNFFDIHAHVYKYPYPIPDGRIAFPNIEELKAAHDKYGISRAALVLLVNAEQYVPQSVGEVIDLANENKDRYVPFCCIDPRVWGNSADAPLERLLEFYKKQGCVGVGEVLPKMDFDDEKLCNLYRACQEMELPLLFDMNSAPDRPYGLYDDAGLVKLSKCLEKFPKLKFIGHGPGFWAEFGKLRKPEDRFGYIDYGIEEEGMIPKVMREYENLYVDLSAGSGLTAISRNIDYTKEFFNEFSDRILYGSDLCFGDGKIGQSRFMNNMLDKGYITEAVYDKIARENAISLLSL